MPHLLDLFCGRFGWSKAFAARGWECVGVDLFEPPEIPQGCRFVKIDVLDLRSANGMIEIPFVGAYRFDFICASPPCEQFSVHGMKNFHKSPPYPELGVKLFNATWELCEQAGSPFIIENVRAAEKFVGNAIHHCGPFYLWGSSVPPLLNQGIKKGMDLGSTKILKSMTIEERRVKRRQYPMMSSSSGSKERKLMTAKVATIPPELANCIADYAERLLEQRMTCL